MTRAAMRRRSLRSGQAGRRRRAADLGQLRHPRREPGRVALERKQPDRVEDPGDQGGVERLALGEHDLLGRRGLWALIAVEELLVELLAGTATDELDRDVLLGQEPRELDHVASEIENSHRIAHLQDVDLATLAQRA